MPFVKSEQTTEYIKLKLNETVDQYQFHDAQNFIEGNLHSTLTNVNVWEFKDGKKAFHLRFTENQHTYILSLNADSKYAHRLIWTLNSMDAEQLALPITLTPRSYKVEAYEKKLPSISVYSYKQLIKYQKNESSEALNAFESLMGYTQTVINQLNAKLSSPEWVRMGNAHDYAQKELRGRDLLEPTPEDEIPF